MANLPNVLRISAALSLMAGTVTAIAQPAQALYFVSGSEFSRVIDFDEFAPGPNGISIDGYTNGLATYSTNVTGPASSGIVVTGSRLTGAGPRYRAPTNPNGTSNTTPYLTVGSNLTGSSGFKYQTVIDFSKNIKLFGLQWGSFDTFNTIQFLLNGVEVGQPGGYTGQEIVAGLAGKHLDGAPGTARGDAGSTAYVRFRTGPGERFNQVILGSTDRAFESDNHSYREVPTPALLPGLIGMGVAALRRKKGEAAAENA